MSGDRPEVVILDYGSGNLHSVTRALAAAGAEVTLSSDPDRARTATGLVVPGVGAFASCMAGLKSIGGDAVIADRAERGRATLGICVGHQVFFGAGVEHGVQSEGLGLFPGTVERMPVDRLPHMGWNTVTSDPSSRLFADPTERFYFVHSYGVLMAEPLRAAGATVSVTEHEGTPVVAAVELGALASVQFHPEKSADAGVGLLRRWVASLDPR